MSSFFSKKPSGPVTADINGVTIDVNPNETVLQAALRQGIDFPYSCRVGGCATCKCKLVEGKVKELTQSGYVLSDDELDQGFILACQSVPKTSLKIEVDLTAQQALKKMPGRVMSQEKLTHDITALRIQLDESLIYKAGQYANLSIDSMPGVQRSYSFANPSHMDAQVTFFVRKVPGGEFSTRIYDENVVGKHVVVEGPMGDFWLRSAQAPMLLVAGGSGLAPILALLQDAASQGVNRSAILLFGARTQADLYGLKTIGEIASKWTAGFDFIPVLSQEPDSSDWSGARGLVTEHMQTCLASQPHAYLCGPPPMVDAATDMLLHHGMPRSDIYADRFTTQHDVVAIAA